MTGHQLGDGGRCVLCLGFPAVGDGGSCPAWRTYLIRREISFQTPLVVEHDGPPPCLYCGEPVTAPSMDGPLVCGPCDGNGGAFSVGRADGTWETIGTPRITEAHRAHFRYCIDHIVKTQPAGRYPPDAGPGWLVGFKENT